MDDQACTARPREEVEREFMNRNEPHSEGHWWAISEIDRLREENAQMRMDHIAAHRVNVATIRFLEDRIKEAEHNAKFSR